MGESSRIAWSIIEQKMMYWHKTLSDNAAWAILSSSLSIFDQLSFFSDTVLSDTLWSTLVSSFLLNIPIIEIEPWNLAWRVELPTVDEFLHGVIIKLERMSVEDLFPEFREAIYSPVLFLEKPVAKAMSESMTEKGVYGKTRYGYSYYDPVAVREFFKSAIYAFTKKPVDVSTAKIEVEKAAKALDINPDLVRDIFNRLSAISVIKEQALTWDYGWWDYSYWGEEGSEGLVTFIDYDLQPKTLPYEDIFDFQAGGFWDESLWDYFYWAGEDTDTMHPYRVDAYNVSELIERLLFNFRSRILTTPLAVINYQTAEERASWVMSKRVDTYDLPVTQAKMLESIVHNIVYSKKSDVSPAELRLYESAVLELYGDTSSPHKWGVGMQRAMTEDELREYWLEKWAAMGLDRDILVELYEKTKKQKDAFTSTRVRERLRFMRQKLIGVK